MTRKNLMLYNVLNQEVVFQEYFCNLLRQKGFMKKFLDFIGRKNEILRHDNIQYHHFYTEYPLQCKEENFGRADIFVNLAEKKIIFEVKNKVYTSLTNNQPHTYLTYLKKTVKNVDFNTCLLFLIPKNYAHKETIYQRWNKQPEQIEKQIFYWEDFVLTLKDEEDAFVKAFYEFCLYWFDLYPLHLNHQEIELLNLKGNLMELMHNTSFPDLMQKLELTTIKIGRHFQWEQDFMKGGYVSGCNYTKKIHHYQLYVGIVYDMWKQYDQPINIYISDAKEYSKEFVLPSMDSLTFNIYESKGDSNFDDFFAYVVQLNFTIDEENYEEKMKAAIEKIINHLK